MTYEEKAAFDWIVKTFNLSPEDVVKSHKSPDFTTPIGGFEVKRLSEKNIISFTGLQMRNLDVTNEFTVLVFSGEDLVAQIPGKVIHDREYTFEGIRIHYDSHDVPITARVAPSIDKALSDIAKETGRKKSDLIREAVIAFIGMHRNARR